MKRPSLRPLSQSWEEFVELYRDYRNKPVWGTWKIVPTGRLRIRPIDFKEIEGRGRRAVLMLEGAVQTIRDSYPIPQKLGPISFAALVRRSLLNPRVLNTLREAVVFDRDAYSCRYCGRSVDGVWENEKRRRTIRLVVDHLYPVSRGGDTHHLRNCVTACWTCNTLKGPLSERAFLHELQSLALAVTQRMK